MAIHRWGEKKKLECRRKPLIKSEVLVCSLFLECFDMLSQPHRAISCRHSLLMVCYAFEWNRKRSMLPELICIWSKSVHAAEAACQQHNSRSSCPLSVSIPDLLKHKPLQYSDNLFDKARKPKHNHMLSNIVQK